MASGGQAIPIVQGLKKTVEAGLHLGALFPELEDWQRRAAPLPEGVNPLFSVSYEEIDLHGIDKVYQLAKSEVLPLKNFILGKQLGQNKNSALSFYCVINKIGEVIYCLAVDSMLIDKLLLSLESPGLSAKMLITNGVYRAQVTHLKNSSSLLEKTVTFNLTSGPTAITKHALENLACFDEQYRRRINFHLTVNIECLGAKVIGVFNISPKISPYMSLKKIYDLPESSKDVTIVASNKSEIKAHKIILMAQSPAFLSMFNRETGMTEANSGRVLMEENSAEGLTTFVRCLYGFEVPVETISPDLALELFQLCHKYDISHLEGSMKDFFNHKDVNWFTKDSLLELYFFAKNLPSFEDLADHALIELSKLSLHSLKSSDYFQELKYEDQDDLLFELWD